MTRLGLSVGHRKTEPRRGQPRRFAVFVKAPIPSPSPASGEGSGVSSEARRIQSSGLSSTLPDTTSRRNCTTCCTSAMTASACTHYAHAIAAENEPEWTESSTLDGVNGGPRARSKLPSTARIEGAEFVFGALQLMVWAIDLYGEPRFGTVEVHNEASDDVLTAEPQWTEASLLAGVNGGPRARQGRAQ